MAFNGKYVSLASIMEKVYRDNGYDLEISWADVAEWAAEAMDLIGVPNALIDKYALINIETHRGNLPCDLHTLVPGTVLNYNTKIPMRAASDVTYQLDRYEALKESNKQEVVTDDNIDPTLGTFQINKYGYPVLPDDIEYLRAKEADKYSYTIRTLPTIVTQDTYTINKNYIFTSFKSGIIMMFYKAFPVDNDGLPLIPDNTRYIKAVACRIAERIDYRLWRTNRLARDVYEKSEQEWLWYVGSAANSMRIFTLDEAESFKNQIVRLIPKINEHYTSFKYSGEQEKIANKNSI